MAGGWSCRCWERDEQAGWQEGGHVDVGRGMNRLDRFKRDLKKKCEKKNNPYYEPQEQPLLGTRSTAVTTDRKNSHY
jgi:hypothetical protein